MGCAYIKLAQLNKAKSALIKAVTLKNDIPEIHFHGYVIIMCDLVVDRTESEEEFILCSWNQIFIDRPLTP